MPSPHRRSRRALLALLAGALLSTLVVPPAGALRVGPGTPDPTTATSPATSAATAPANPTTTAPPVTTTGAGDDLSPQHVEAIAEQYNLARLQVERASAVVVATERRIDAAQQRVELVKARVRARAAAIYRSAGSSVSLPLPSTQDFGDRERKHAYLDAAQHPDRNLIDTLSSQLRDLRNQRVAAQEAEANLRRQADDAARLKRRLQDLAAKAAADARAAADAAGPVGAPTATAATSGPAAGTGSASGTGSDTSTSTTTRPATPPTTRTTAPPTATPPATTSPPTGGDPGGGPPVSSGAAKAIAFARAQLGKPYAFATAGPATFDCSGLTMAAWATAGVRMPHYSGSQATMFPKVTWDQLQPGDIVVFYDDLHHVGLYIGGGMMIHAPQTGDVVKISPAWRTTFMWGVRPG